MKKNYILKIALASYFSLLAGCGTSTWAHRDTNPTIQDQTYGTNPFKNMFGSTSVNTFATTASRRLVLVLQTNDKQNNKELILTCSEPSPDVGEAFASAVGLAKMVALIPLTQLEKRNS